MKWFRAFSCLVFGLLSVEGRGEEFNPKQVVRPFDPIVDPEVVSVNQAGDLVRDEELVLGVVVNGEARAYPINMLTNPTREIVNDTVGGRALAATW